MIRAMLEKTPTIEMMSRMLNQLDPIELTSAGIILFDRNIISCFLECREIRLVRKIMGYRKGTIGPKRIRVVNMIIAVVNSVHVLSISSEYMKDFILSCS